jgi:Domain of unknown function (DUF4926)
MTFEDLDPVVLDVDIPEHGLPKRSLGAVVHVYASDVFEVEFVTANGRTAALVTLKSSQLRKPSEDDLLCVNRLATARHSIRAAKRYEPRRRR